MVRRWYDRRLLLVAILLAHVGLVAYGGATDCVTIDEPGHLASGLFHWQVGRFRPYSVNPPLVRLVAVFPLNILGYGAGVDCVDERPGSRPEYALGPAFIEENGSESLWALCVARWSCLPLTALGAYVCYSWAHRLYGCCAGLFALVMWCVSPTVLAFSRTITPDVGASALGVAAIYLFWRWSRKATFTNAMQAGVVLGLAELTKFTLIVFVALCAVFWVLWRLGGQVHGRIGMKHMPSEETSDEIAFCRPDAVLVQSHAPAWQLVSIMTIAVVVINVGYGFEGAWKPLGGYAFVSRMLSGLPDHRNDSIHTASNRFSDGWLGKLPVPLPENYVSGIDIQKREFEKKDWSYLRGEWRVGGWWYYYLYALAVKVPLGTWVLVLLASCVGLFTRGYAAGWCDELMLIAPIMVVLALVSSQTGFNHHMRYVLPIFPFAFIWVSKLARCVEFRHWKLAAVAGAALLWSVGSSLYYYPHSLSYFNESVGGPKNGHRHLLDSNIDWGQDLYYLKAWLNEHPEARPVSVGQRVSYLDPKLIGINHSGKPPMGAPCPGWHAISVDVIHDPSGKYEYFLRIRPVAMAGYSIHIYHITTEEANSVRRQMGLPEIQVSKTR